MKMPTGEGIDLNDRTQFMFVEGRYFAAMYFVQLPKQDNELLRNGGDVTALLWRNEATTTDWVFQWRFRYYKDTVTTFDSNDKKVWYCCEPKGETEKECREKVQSMLSTLARFAGTKLHTLEMNGPVERAMDVMQNNPPFWLHSQQVVQE
jgi:hypothetical protein